MPSAATEVLVVLPWGSMRLNNGTQLLPKLLSMQPCLLRAKPIQTEPFFVRRQLMHELEDSSEAGHAGVG